MKQITKFITEKFRINKKSKLNDTFAQEILNFLYGEPEDATPEEVKIFTDWSKKYNVEYMTIICSKETLIDYYALDSEHDVEDIIKQYNNNDFVDLILQDNTFTLLGDEIWKSKYENTRLYLEKEGGWLCWVSKMAGQIYFVPKKISKKEASKYTNN